MLSFWEEFQMQSRLAQSNEAQDKDCALLGTSTGSTENLVPV